MANYGLIFILIFVTGWLSYDSVELQRRFVVIGILLLIVLDSFIKPFLQIAQTLKDLEELARIGRSKD